MSGTGDTSEICIYYNNEKSFYELIFCVCSAQKNRIIFKNYIKRLRQSSHNLIADICMIRADNVCVESKEHHAILNSRYKVQTQYEGI